MGIPGVEQPIYEGQHRNPNGMLWTGQVAGVPEEGVTKPELGNQRKPTLVHFHAKCSWPTQTQNLPQRMIISL